MVTRDNGHGDRLAVHGHAFRSSRSVPISLICCFQAGAEASRSGYVIPATRVVWHLGFTRFPYITILDIVK